MKIFKLKKKYNYFEFILFGVKISHRLNLLNKFISLGTNCFPRMKMNQFKIKPSKRDGELSCPFDLCTTPLESVAKILENDFADYFEDIQYDEEKKCWKNTKYKIFYIHDDLNKEDFIKRYKQRIKNFRHITNTQKNILFVQVLFNAESNDKLFSDIEKTNNSLKRYCKYKYTYKIVNLIPQKTPSKRQLIKVEENAYYYEHISPYDTKWTQWWTKETDSLPEVKPLIKSCIDTIYNG